MLPKKIRKELGGEEKFYIILGNDGEIWGLDKLNFHKQAEKILEIPLSETEGRLRRRKFFSQADECLLDGQGRFILPQEFIDQAELKDEVLIIGAGDHFEIWSSEGYVKYDAQKI